MISRCSEQSHAAPLTWADTLQLPIAEVGPSEPASTEDAELMARLQARDCKDLDLLFDRYSRLVLATAYRVLGDPSEAEEVVQEVFFYLYRRSELFHPSKGSVKAWIVQIAFSRALDRKSYLSRRHFQAGADLNCVEVRQSTDLEQEIERRLSRKHLERAFTELTQMQRRTIEFFYFEELELREISERLREPLGNVRHYLYRGLERLRKKSYRASASPEIKIATLVQWSQTA